MSLSFGLTSGFLCHYWYNFLDKKIPGKTIGIVTRKIIYDQLLFSPILIVACLGVAGLIEASSRQKILTDIKEKGKCLSCSQNSSSSLLNLKIALTGTRLYIAEWFIWPPAQFVNFYFLPTKFRVVYDNFISLGYDMYTSHVKFETKAHAIDATSDTSAIPSVSNDQSWFKSIQNSKDIWSLNLNFDSGDW